MNRCDNCGRFATDASLVMVESNWLDIEGMLNQEWSFLHLNPEDCKR